MNTTQSMRVLRHEVASLSLDPLTLVEIGPTSLPAGTIIEDAERALAVAEAHGDAALVVRARLPDQKEWIGIERVSTVDLRRALRD
jgi:hypothetical protein